MQRRDRAADGDDRLVLGREGARRVDEVDHDVEEAPIVRQEVPPVRGDGRGAEEIPPGRAVRPTVDPLRHLGQEITKEAGGRRGRVVLAAGAEDAGQERGPDVLVDAVDQPGEGRGGGKVCEQVLVAGDRLKGALQRVEGQVEERVRVEAAGIDPIADARRPGDVLAKGAGQAGRAQQNRTTACRTLPVSESGATGDHLAGLLLTARPFRTERPRATRIRAGAI